MFRVLTLSAWSNGSKQWHARTETHMGSSLNDEEVLISVGVTSQKTMYIYYDSNEEENEEHTKISPGNLPYLDVFGTPT